jgi:hypothetical protein
VTARKKNYITRLRPATPSCDGTNPITSHPECHCTPGYRRSKLPRGPTVRIQTNELQVVLMRYDTKTKFIIKCSHHRTQDHLLGRHVGICTVRAWKKTKAEIKSHERLSNGGPHHPDIIEDDVLVLFVPAILLRQLLVCPFFAVRKCTDA